MAGHSQRTALGRLRLVGERAEECARAAELAMERAARRTPSGEFVSVLGVRAYFKGEPLRGWARARWTLKHALFFRPLPRVSELANLRWLRARQFLAPRPICAGVLSRKGAPWYQFLLTEDVTGAETLERFLAEAQTDAALRAEVLDVLADEVARMHALRFVHHDLYARNVLVVRGAPRPRVYFLDAWAGGTPPQWRGAAYDMTCLVLDLTRHSNDREVDGFIARYCAGRADQGRPVDRERLGRRMRRERQRLLQ